jgi:hypothetical protein
MTQYTTRIRPVSCYKAAKGYQPVIEFRYRRELYSFAGSIHQRRWAADDEAQRMGDRIDAYVEIIAAQNS